MRFKRLTYLFALIGLALVVGVMATSRKALAFSTTAPIQSSAPETNSANITGDGTNIQPWFAVGEGDYDGQFSYSKVYVPKGQTATLTVIQGNGVCGIDVGSPEVKYEVYTLDNLENMPGTGGGNRIGLQNNQSAGGCGSLTFNLSGGTASIRIGHEKYDVYYFQATITGPGVGDNEKNFRLSVNNGLVGVSRPVVDLGSKPWFGIYMRDAPSRGGDNWDYAVQFASYCNETSNSPRGVSIYDIDYGVYPQPNLTGLVDKDARDAGGYNWTLAPPGHNPTDPTAEKVSDEWPSGNHTQTNLSFQYDNSYRYLLEFRDVDWHNTIQVSLPFDQFDAQPIVGQACDTPVTPTIACTPASQKIGDGSSANINLTASVPTGNWPSNYYIERVGPSYRQVSNPGSASGTDTVNPPNDVTDYRYTYTVYDSKTNGAVSGVASAVCVVSTSKTNPIYCIATPKDANPSTGQADTITVTLYNNSTSNLKGGQLRQVSPGGGAWPASGFGNFATGQQATHGYSILARNTPQTVTFQYTLFTGTGGGDPVFPGTNNPLCTTSITWKKPGVPSINVSCQNINVAGGISTATYEKLAYLQERSNIDVARAVLGSQILLARNVPEPPPPGPPTPSPSPSGPTAVQIKKIPIKLEMTGNGIDEVKYEWIDNNINANKNFDTFNTFDQAWPHNSGYVITLSYVPDGASQANVDDGNFYANENWAVAGQANVPICLTASASTVCAGPSTDPGPVQPGQDFTFTYKIQLNNLTNKTFSASDPNGYSIYGHTDGGLTPLFSNPLSASPISPGTTVITASLPVRVDYTGRFWVDFRFKGNILPLADDGTWDGQCGNPNNPGSPGTPGSDTPAAEPFFQVWNSGVSAGGGFKNTSGSCGASGDPPYISPKSTNYSGYQDAYSGGIRTFANKNGGRGSSSDFGALALGWIIGSPGGPVGFYSNSGVMFANTTGTQPPGGYLNSNSQGHCVDDFFTNTRTSATPSGFPGFGAASGQYSASPGDFSGGSITAGQQITVYVDGDVNITSNITYPQSFNPSTGIPYFALIVRGNITVDSSVTQLDGLYVAQPQTDGSGGVFSTCDSMCNQQLVVDGAVIAQRVEPLRAHGTVGPLDADPNGLGTSPAEIFNYVPSMVLGAPEFQPQGSGLESIFSLPPVF